MPPVAPGRRCCALILAAHAAQAGVARAVIGGDDDERVGLFTCIRARRRWRRRRRVDRAACSPHRCRGPRDRRARLRPEAAGHVARQVRQCGVRHLRQCRALLLDRLFPAAIDRVRNMVVGEQSEQTIGRWRLFQQIVRVSTMVHFHGSIVGKQETCGLASLRMAGSKCLRPPPSSTSTRSMYCGAMSSSRSRLGARGEACRRRVADARRCHQADALATPFASTAMASSSRPSGSVFRAQLKMRLPEPHAVEAAAESVTSELSEAMSK